MQKYSMKTGIEKDRLTIIRDGSEIMEYEMVEEL